MAVMLTLMCLSALHSDELLVATEHVTTLSDVLVVDARPVEAYTTGHIPGAAHLDVDTLSETRDQVAGLLKPLPALRALLGEAGVDPSRHIVVYSQMDSPADFKTATRLFWILEYLGYERVSILDGGFAKWKSDGRTIESGESTIQPVDLPELRPREERFATLNEVEDAIESGTAKVVDLRSFEYYCGEKKADSVETAGHIPGASNLDGDSVVSERGGVLKSWEELMSLVSGSGVSEGDSAITYCNTGRSASVGYFTLRRLGVEDVSLYDGSMSEWTAKGKAVDASPEDANGKASVE